MLDNLIGPFHSLSERHFRHFRLPGQTVFFRVFLQDFRWNNYLSRLLFIRIVEKKKKRKREWTRLRRKRRLEKANNRRAQAFRSFRCLGLSLDLGLDLSTFAIVLEAIPYWLWGGRASEHITWLNRPNGIATGLAALTLLKYPPPSPRPFNKTFTRGPPN